MINKALLNNKDTNDLLKDALELATQRKDLTYIFKSVPFEVFGTLQFCLSHFPEFKEILPPMPSKKEQLKWTGTCDLQLLNTAVTYVTSLLMHASIFTDTPVKELKFLDHGCGWGRIPRFISKYIPAQNIFGLDPMQHSINICLRDKVPGTYGLCSPFPDDLPVNDQKFDLINCFSVFTHLSEKYQFRVLEVLRQYISKNGLLAATIRRELFWTAQKFNQKKKKELITAHHENGFVHIPGTNLGCESDEPFFGDTTISIEYVKNKWNGWRLVGSEISFLQPGQIVLFLKPE